MKTLFIKFFIAYKLIVSPFLPNRCKFFPSCSSYAILSVKKHGFFRGSYIFLKRFIKCNYYHHGGYDPIA